MVGSSQVEEGRAEAVLNVMVPASFIAKLMSTVSASVPELCVPSGEQLSSVCSGLD